MKTRLIFNGASKVFVKIFLAICIPCVPMENRINLFLFYTFYLMTRSLFTNLEIIFRQFLQVRMTTGLTPQQLLYTLFENVHDPTTIMNKMNSDDSSSDSPNIDISNHHFQHLYQWQSLSSNKILTNQTNLCSQNLIIKSMINHFTMGRLSCNLKDIIPRKYH